MRLRTLGFAALVLAMACRPPQNANHPLKLPTFAPLQAWAGKDAGGLGFTQEKLVAFLTDREMSWTEITDVKPSVFGFPVVVHPKDPNTAWFVPAIKDERRIPAEGRVVVNRTRDGGRTFETLHRGLPQAWAYDLVYRHALDLDATGERLAFGSTTGSVWISENQGDDWITLGEHLPPVHAVLFV